MDISESTQNGIHIFTLGGRIDTLSVAAVDQALQGAVSEGKHNLVLDMSDVNYINSNGSRTLATVLTRLRELGGDLKLAALSKKVLRVFQIIGFDKIFSLYDTVELALAGF
jgi:anti-sigma B factor antagonist